MARMPASAWRPSCENCGKTPSGLTISAAPTIATFPGVGTGSGSLRRPPGGQRDVVGDFRWGQFERHIELQRFRRLLAIDDVRCHLHALFELNDGNRIRGDEARRWPVVDYVAEQGALAAGLEPLDFRERVGGIEGARREVGLTGRFVALNHQLAFLQPVPVGLSLRGGLWGHFRIVVQRFLPCLESGPAEGPGCERNHNVYRERERSASGRARRKM